jgi:hypothetical protein
LNSSVGVRPETLDEVWVSFVFVSTVTGTRSLTWSELLPARCPVKPGFHRLCAPTPAVKPKSGKTGVSRDTFIALSHLFLVPILSQLLLALVRRDLMSLPLSSAGHCTAPFSTCELINSRMIPTYYRADGQTSGSKGPSPVRVSRLIMPVKRYCVKGRARRPHTGLGSLYFENFPGIVDRR